MTKKAPCQQQWKRSSGLQKKTRQNSVPASLIVSYTTANITLYTLTTKHDLRLYWLGFLLCQHFFNSDLFFFFLQMDFNSTSGKEQYPSLPLPTTHWLNSAWGELPPGQWQSATITACHLHSHGPAWNTEQVHQCDSSHQTLMTMLIPGEILTQVPWLCWRER